MIIEVLVSLFLLWLIQNSMNIYLIRRRMPPGPIPYPLVGNLPQLLSAGGATPFEKLTKKYGDIFTISLPSGNSVILSNVSLAREAKFAGKQDDLAGRSEPAIYPLKEIFGNDLALCDYTPVYRLRRKVFVSAMHIFGSGLEKSSVRARCAVETLIEEIESKQGRPFSPKGLLVSCIEIQLWDWLTSHKVGLNDPVLQELKEFSIIANRQAFFSSLFQLVPFLRYFPNKIATDINRANEIKNTIFRREYQCHLDTYTPDVIRDLTDSFISAYDKEMSKGCYKDLA
jgi:cytochrome P450 family 1 subfamily A polypeptide 1